MPHTIGDRIKEALKKSKNTQRALSKALHVSEPAVSAYISGKSEPSIQGLSIIADVTGVSLEWLITGIDAQTDKPVLAESAQEYGQKKRSPVRMTIEERLNTWTDEELYDLLYWVQTKEREKKD